MRVGRLDAQIQYDDAGAEGAGAGNEGGKDIAYFQAEAKKAFEARQAAKKEADELRKQLESFKGIDAEEYKTLKAEREQAEQDRAKKAGEFEKLQQQLVQKHATELQMEREGRTAAEQKLHKTIIGRAFADAVDLFGPAGKTIYLPVDAERIFGDRVKLLEDGTVAVTDATGDVILNSKTGKPESFSAAMAEYIESLPDKQYRLRGSGKTGSGSSGGTTGGGGRDEFDVTTLTPEQRRDPKVIAALRARRPRGTMVFGEAYQK